MNNKFCFLPSLIWTSPGLLYLYLRAGSDNNAVLIASSSLSLLALESPCTNKNQTASQSLFNLSVGLYCAGLSQSLCFFPCPWYDVIHRCLILTLHVLSAHVAAMCWCIRMLWIHRTATFKFHLCAKKPQFPIHQTIYRSAQPDTVMWLFTPLSFYGCIC